MSKPRTQPTFTRRTVARGAVWAVPVAAVGVAAPAFAASNPYAMAGCFAVASGVARYVLADGTSPQLFPGWLPLYEDDTCTVIDDSIAGSALIWEGSISAALAVCEGIGGSQIIPVTSTPNLYICTA